MDMNSIEKQIAFQSTIVPLISAEEITYEKVKINPILRPLAEKNNSYLLNEKNIVRALKELDSTQERMKEIIDSNPDIYESTAIVAKMERYKLFAAQVIHGLILQKDDLKTAINQMLEINGIEYGLKREEIEEDFRPSLEPIKIQPKIEVPPITYFDTSGNAIPEEPKDNQ
jgi:hypothetical protein